MRTMEELGKELCKYCPLDGEAKGIHSFDDQVSFCCESGYCDIAYDHYQDECTEKCIGCSEKIHPDEANYIVKAASNEYGPLCQNCYDKEDRTDGK